MVFLAILGTQAIPAASASDLDAAIRMQKAGRNAEALKELLALVPVLTQSGDGPSLARALSATTDAELALGDYEAALHHAREAFDAHQRTADHTEAAWDMNAVGLANLSLGRYDAARDAYQRALQLDRANRDGDGEVTRLNNIGNVDYYQGRYADAQRLYEEALGALNVRASPGGRPRLRKMTLTNLATLHQRLGREERALDMYAELKASAPEAMRPSEEAQLLLNEGALVRRLGDPVKALALYHAAQHLFEREPHADGQIGAWRNIGIAYALDLGNFPAALEAFTTAVQFADRASNLRGEVQSRLYRGETLRRMGRMGEAERDLRAALDMTAAPGLVEERWKAQFGLGLVERGQGLRDEARHSFESAVATIESIRADLRTVPLRTEFLADKRDVYDALIGLRLSESPRPVDDLFRLIERSRARTWLERLPATSAVPDASLRAVQARLDSDSTILEYWVGTTQAALLWLDHSSSGIVEFDHLETLNRVVPFVDELSRGGSGWRTDARSIGLALLAHLPTRGQVIPHLTIVPDGVLGLMPFEALVLPHEDELLIERYDVTYLPSAAYLLRPTRERVQRAWPWTRELVGFGDPPTATVYPIDDSVHTAALPLARAELRAVASQLTGAATLHLGSSARKALLSSGHDGNAPLLHVSTHAVADTRDPERSRILFAADQPGQGADYLFLREIYDLDLTGVDLATISACDTARGKTIRGEGVQAFSRAFLAAGAAATVTSLWEIGDQSGAAFMPQFYYSLAEGQPKAAALRSAKLRFLHSGTAWAHPRYWAVFVLTGEGRTPIPPVIPWSMVSGGGALVVAAVALIGATRKTPWRRMASKAARSTEARSS